MKLTEKKTYYPNGNVCTHFFEDENGRRQGLLNYYYTDGEIFRKLELKDSYCHGNFYEINNFFIHYSFHKNNNLEGIHIRIDRHA